MPSRPSIIRVQSEQIERKKQNVAVTLLPAKPETKTVLVRFPAPVKIKNPAAVALGKLGGSKGGRIRAENLSDERKKEIAQQAARARWAKEKANHAKDFNGAGDGS